jgi:hypothetical protein
MKLLGDQRKRLRLGEHGGLSTKVEAADFLAEVGIALRYGPAAQLPLASMYQAVWNQAGKAPEPEQEAQRRATQLTNALISDGTAVEVNVIGDRVGLVHASLVPPLIALRRRGRGIGDLDLSRTARDVLAFIAKEPRPTAGAVRLHVGVAREWPNPADDALAELQRDLVIDRGPTETPASGAPYLGKEGIPYRLVDDVHAAHVRAAGKLGLSQAADALVLAYLRGARFAPRKKLAKLLALCLSAAELDASVDRLTAARRLETVKLDGKDVIVAK